MLSVDKSKSAGYKALAMCGRYSHCITYDVCVLLVGPVAVAMTTRDNCGGEKWCSEHVTVFFYFLYTNIFTFE